MINVDIFNEESFISFIQNTFNPKEIIKVDSQMFVDGIHDEGCLKNIQAASIKSIMVYSHKKHESRLELHFLSKILNQVNSNKECNSVFIRQFPTKVKERDEVGISARIGIF